MFSFLFFLVLDLNGSEKALPKTGEEVKSYVKELQETTDKRIDKLIEVSKEEDISGKMLRPWNQLSNEIVSGFRVLFYLSESECKSCKQEAMRGMRKFKNFLHKSVIKNRKLYDSLMVYIHKSFQKNELLTPYERQGLYSLLESFNAVGFQEKVLSLKAFLSNKERHAFLYLEIPAAKPKVDFNQDLSIMTLNTCFIPDEFPYLFGGAILPWQERIKPLSRAIKFQSPDLVCLQEVFSEDTFYALLEELSGEYKYFYGLIGPRFLGLSFQSVGMPSGLFVASKLPIIQAQFTPYRHTGYAMNQGFFDFIVDKAELSAHIYVTHMQSLNDKKFVKVRTQQTRQIIDKIHKDAATDNPSVAHILCGDLNIPFGEGEPSEKLLYDSFQSDYVSPGTLVDSSNSTCTGFFSEYHLADPEDVQSIQIKYQILDYVLLWKLNASCHLLKTSRVPMNDIKAPHSAMSDHHALLTRVQKR